LPGNHTGEGKGDNKLIEIYSTHFLFSFKLLAIPHPPSPFDMP